MLSLKKRKQLPPLIPWFLALLVRCIRATYRKRLTDPAGFLTSGEPWPVIFVAWHNRIVFLPGMFPASLRKRTAALVSASRDGNYATAFIRHFGYRTVRGSTSRGGHGALRKMRRELGQGRSVVITMDGPRGPKYEVHPGAAGLAQLSDVPVIPLSLNAPGRWELKSWDRTQIPKPFSKVEVVIGHPLRFDAAAGLNDREAASAKVREALLAVTDDTQN